MNETRILVVDDEEDLCEILKFNLENEGYENIDCKAQECTYNDQRKCTASAIDVVGCSTDGCNETKCNTFSCKC